MRAHAGPIAEGLYLAQQQGPDESDTGLEDWIAGAYLGGGHGDLEIVRESLVALGDPSGMGVELERIAHQIVTDSWAAVGRVAAALLTHSTLTYGQVVELVDGAGPRGGQCSAR